jgi:hypothetical protein
MAVQEGAPLTHGNTVPGRTDHTWIGPDTTINAKRTMTGDEFNRLRADADATRQAGIVQADQSLDVQLMNAGLPAQAARIIAAKLDEIKVQLSLLRNLPPHMAKQERRG